MRIVLRTSDMLRRKSDVEDNPGSTGALENALKSGFEVWVLSSCQHYTEEDDFWRRLVPKERVFNHWDDPTFELSMNRSNVWKRLFKALGIELPEGLKKATSSTWNSMRFWRYTDCVNYLREQGVVVGPPDNTQDVNIVFRTEILEDVDAWVKTLPGVVQVTKVEKGGFLTRVDLKLAHTLHRISPFTRTFAKALYLGTCVLDAKSGDTLIG